MTELRVVRQEAETSTQAATCGIYKHTCCGLSQFTLSFFASPALMSPTARAKGELLPLFQTTADCCTLLADELVQKCAEARSAAAVTVVPAGSTALSTEMPEEHRHKHTHEY